MTHLWMLRLPFLAAFCCSYVLGADPDPKSCTTYVVAGVDESCGTIAKTYGIDMYDFIGLNPELVSCVLVNGTSYCIGTDDTATTTLARPTSSSSPTGSPGPTGSLIPSPDGSDGICGDNYTCLDSVYGQCCSAHGYCGDSTEYCGEGCNPAFGRCGGGVDVPANTTSESPGGCTVTLISVSTATETVSVVKTLTATTTVTATATATATAKPTSTQQPSGPRPILDGTIASCSTYYQLTRLSDSCSQIARANGISIFQLYNWNPNLDCDYPQGSAGYYICVGV